MNYPDHLPCPNWEFTQNIEAHTRRTGFDSGWQRQRRRWKQHTYLITLGFTLTTSEYEEWAEWMFINGAQWFTLPLDRYGGTIQEGEVRLTDPWSPTYHDFDRVEISVPAELREQPSGGSLISGTEYPEQFALPDTDSYAGSVDQGIIATSVSTAQRTQIQAFNQAAEQYSMTFHMTNDEYIYWIVWVRENAYRWFRMRIVSKQTSIEVNSPQWIRFISNVAYAKQGDDWASCTVLAEVLIGDLQGIDVDNRIIAGTPSNPSSDRFIAGSPDAPSEDLVIALLRAYRE